jgi:hypothetical protein
VKAKSRRYFSSKNILILPMSAMQQNDYTLWIACFITGVLVHVYYAYREKKAKDRAAREKGE